MPTTYTLHSTTNITRHITRHDNDPAQIILETGESYVTGDYPNADYYVVSNVITARPDFPISLPSLTIDADGVDEAVFTSIPTDTVVSVALVKTVTMFGTAIEQITDLGLGAEITDGSFELTADYPGVYRVTFKLFPYKDLVVDVTATS